MRALAIFSLMALLVGCPDATETATTDPGDAGTVEDTGSVDASVDVGPDDVTSDAPEPDSGESDAVEPDAAEPDAAEPDASEDPDAGDVAADVEMDVEMDVASDVAPDVEMDVAPDVEMDVAPDVEMDVAPDVEMDVASDVEMDVAPDTGDVDPGDVDPGDVDPADVDPADVDPADVPDTAPEDVGPGDVGPEDTGPEDVSPADVEDINVNEIFASDTATDAGPDAGASDPEVATLEFLNHPSTTKSVLTSQVGLTGSAPGAIIEFRAGVDEELGTEDDVMIPSLASLDDLSGVGQGTIDKLVAFARNWSPTITDPLLVALNASDLAAVTLENDAGISASSAAAIVAYRGGDDLTVGTDDDRLFYSRKEVDDITGVGPATMNALEVWAGIGTVEVLSTETSANLVAVAFGPLGEALVVGTPVGGTAHVLWYTPFSEDATIGEDPYVFLPLEGVPEAMNAAAFAPQGDIAAVAGEADGIYVFDTFEKQFDFVAVAGVEGFTDLAFSTDGSVVYGATVAAGIKSYNFTDASVADVIDSQSLALAPGGAGYLLVSAGAAGEVLAVDESFVLSDWSLSTTEDLFDLFVFGDAYVATGSTGFAGMLSTDWSRIPTRTLEAVRGGAVSESNTLLLVGADGLIIRYDPNSGEVAPITPSISADLWSVGFSDDGTALAVGANGIAVRYTPPAEL